MTFLRQLLIAWFGNWPEYRDHVMSIFYPDQYEYEDDEDEPNNA